MEDTLRVLAARSGNQTYCLNPCFNGRYSQRSMILAGSLMKNLVLILVLMEDTLRDEPEIVYLI